MKIKISANCLNCNQIFQTFFDTEGMNENEEEYFVLRNFNDIETSVKKCICKKIKPFRNKYGFIKLGTPVTFIMENMDMWGGNREGILAYDEETEEYVINTKSSGKIKTSGYLCAYWNTIRPIHIQDLSGNGNNGILCTINEDIKQRIGILRQWLNEDRITDENKMVSNEQIKRILFRNN